MEMFSDILMTVNRQSMVSQLSPLGQHLLICKPGDYFPVVFHYADQVQTLSVAQKGSQRPLDCWLAPMRNAEGRMDGFALIRQRSRLLLPDSTRIINTFQRFTREELQQAIAGNELFLVYQPEKRARDQQTRVAEALLRWRRPNGSVLQAQEFLPEAERLGLAQEIGAWVISAVCRQNRRWQMQGLRPISISVNLSPEQLTSELIIQHVTQHLDRCGLPAHYLQFEVNSRCLHGDGLQDIAVLQRLKSLGLRLMLDDLRMSDASWQQLLLWPVDAVKIAYPQWNNTLAAVARGLGKVLIVRGVEKPSHWSSAAADALQGHGICLPLEPDQLAHRLDRSTWAA